MTTKSSYRKKYHYFAFARPEVSKIRELIAVKGMEGYGVLHAVIQHILDDPNTSLDIKSIGALATEWKTDEETLRYVLKELFDGDEYEYTHPKITKEVKKRNKVSSIRRKTALSNWKKKKQEKESREVSIEPAPEIKKKPDGRKAPAPTEGDKALTVFWWEKLGHIWTSGNPKRKYEEVQTLWENDMRLLRQDVEQELKDRNGDPTTAPRVIQALILWLDREATDNARFWKQQVQVPGKLRKRQKDTGKKYFMVLFEKMKHDQQNSSAKPIVSV